MPRHTLTEAALLAGISRAALYSTYINRGLLTISKDHRNRPYVETAELVRVFGQLESLQIQQQTTPVDTSATELALLKQEIQYQQKLLDAKDRELELKNQLIAEKDARLMLVDNMKTTKQNTDLQHKRRGLMGFLFGDKS